MSHQDTAANNAFLSYEQYMVPALFLPQSQILCKYADLKRGQRVLDVACGTGIVARQAAPIVGAQGSVSALDLNPAMMAVGRAAPAPDGAKIEWKEGSALSLPYPDQSFDVVFCEQGIQFFPDRLAAVKEMRRVLVPGGRAVISVCQSLDQNPIYKVFNDILMRHMGMPALMAPFIVGDPAELHALLANAGFAQVEVSPESFPARFPNTPIFVEASLIGSAAAVTALAQVDVAARQAMMAELEQELSATLAPYVQNGALTFPVAINIGHARA